MSGPRPDLPVYRRLTYLLLLGQSLTSAAFIASATVGAIAGAHLSGRPELAGLPSAVYLLGAALASYPASRLMERVGRRLGLTTGLGLGVTGALLNGLAINSGSFGLFLLGYALMGATRGFTDLGRYAAAEMHPLAERARAISLVVLGGTAGAILGPALVGPTGQLALSFGLEELSGPSFAGAALFAVGLLLIFVFLRPDPSVLARQFAADADAAAANWRMGAGSPPPLMTGDANGDACDSDDDDDFFQDIEEQRVYDSAGFAGEQLAPCDTGPSDVWPPDMSPSGALDHVIDTGDVIFILGFVGLGPASPGYSVRYDISSDAGNAIDTGEVLLILGFVGMSCQQGLP